jgi:hypothetical protein
MPIPIKVNSTDVVITPFFDMQHKDMLHNYHKGIRSQIESEHGPPSHFGFGVIPETRQLYQPV